MRPDSSPVQQVCFRVWAGTTGRHLLSEEQHFIKPGQPWNLFKASISIFVNTNPFLNPVTKLNQSFVTENTFKITNDKLFL